MHADDLAGRTPDDHDDPGATDLDALDRLVEAESARVAAAGDVPDDSPRPSRHQIAQRIIDAAVEAEYETGDREETDEEARRNVLLRLVRMFAGFVIIGIGIGGLLLPGPGWLLIILGLSLLPFAWAERTIRLIRRRIPGVPEDGRIPTSTWIVMGTMLVAFTALSLLFGGAISDWVSGLWGDPDKLIT